VVDAAGFSSRDWNEAVAITPGGGRVGAVLSGSVNDQLADLAAQGRTGRLIRLHVSEVDALVAGLSCGGDARCLIMPAADLPAELWDRLRHREPLCLVADLDGEEVTGTRLYAADNVADAGEEAARLFARAQSAVLVTEDAVVTVLSPVAKLLIVGSGAIAAALTTMAELLSWRPQVVTELAAATGAVAGLAGLDKVVVLSHDDELAGPVLAAALDSPVGYIGALGSRRTQQARADWLAYRGVTDLTRVHGPAGLDIGASTPGEIAVSIVAEALAVGAGKAGNT
jgi:xanthine dehydrogenase accessory factor